MQTWLVIVALVFSLEASGQISLEHLSESSPVMKIENKSLMLPDSKLKYHSVMVLSSGSNQKEFNPFFCKIEDAIAKSSKVQFKFRLGSVQYVDALEGKSYWEAVSYSKATNQFLKQSHDKR